MNRRGDWAHDYDQLEQQVAAQSYYEQDSYEKGFEPGYERQDERPARSYQPAPPPPSAWNGPLTER